MPRKDRPPFLHAVIETLSRIAKARSFKFVFFISLGFCALVGAAIFWPDGRLTAWFWNSGENNSLILSGNIEAHESVLSFKSIQSRITELPFDEGATVEAGTVLARADDADYRQQVAIDTAALVVQERQLASARQNVEAARHTVANDRADFAQKQLDFGRNEALFQNQAVSAQARDLALTAEKQSRATLERDRALERVAKRNVELAAATVDSARATLGMARIVLGYTTLAAPFAGVILVRQAELGENIVPGTPVVTLADIDHVWLRAYVNETDISRIRLGEAATVTTDSYPGKQYSGRISFIASQAEFTPKSVETHAERVTLVYRIRIDIYNPSHELVPGLPGDAHIALLPAGAR